MYDKSGMSSKGEGLKCGVAKRMKQSTLIWYEHMERMAESEMIKKAYKSVVNAVGTREWPLVKWEDTVQEYVRKGVKGQ